MRIKLRIVSLTICLASGLFGNEVMAQLSPSWIWAKSAGGNDDEFVQCSASDAAGNVYIAGHFRSPSFKAGAYTITQTSGLEIFIVKYNSSGVALWARNIPGLIAYNVRGLAIDAGGNVLVTGSCWKSTNEQIYVAKLSSSGTNQWLKYPTTPSSYSIGNAITADAAGNVCVTGAFKGLSIIFGNDTLKNPSNYSSKVLIVKYNTSGNVVWARTGTSGSSDDMGHAITSDASNNILVGGEFGNINIKFGNISLPNSTNAHSEGFVVKFDPSGTPLWGKKVGGYEDEGVQSVAVDAIGDVYICGYFKSNSITIGTTTLSNNLNTGGNCYGWCGDLFLAKYSAIGTVQWAKKAGGSYDDYATSIQVNSSKQVYISGYTDSRPISFGNIDLTGYKHGFAAKYDPSGSILWAKEIETFDSTIYVSLAPNDEVYLAGVFYEPASFDTINLQGMSNLDAFVARLNGTSGLGLEEYPSHQNINIFPNPFTTSTIIHLNSNVHNAEISLYNMLGEKMREIKNLSGNEFILQRNGLSNGIYMMRCVEKGKEIAVQRLVVSD